MSQPNHTTGKAKRNPEIMQAAIEAVREGIGIREAAARNDMGVTTMSAAYAVITEAPGLIDRVLAGELTIWKARQIAVKGEMHTCPICEGRGYVFRKKN